MLNDDTPDWLPTPLAVMGLCCGRWQPAPSFWNEWPEEQYSYWPLLERQLLQVHLLETPQDLGGVCCHFRHPP